MSWHKLAVVWMSVVALGVIAGCGGGPKPIAVTVTASSATVDPTNTSTLTAAVANDKKSGGVTWAVSGGGALSNTSTTGATYTAPAPANSPLTVTVTATSVADGTKTGTVSITVPAGPAVATNALAVATVGTAYSVTMTGTGGIPPYAWTITSGTLPAGLTMTAGGVISGTPTAAGVGTANLSFKMVDSGTPNSLSAAATLGLKVNAAPAITFTTTTLTDGTYNAAYSATVAATGGAGTLTYTLASGALPTGLTLSSAGVISGTPTVVGTFSISVKAADAFGDSATQALSLKMSYPQLVITPTTLPTGYMGSVYTATTLAATGGSGTGYSFALQSGSSLPAGLTLSAAGTIAGTPTVTGTSTFTAVVTDSASNTATLAMSIVVKAALTITTVPALPTAYIGTAYSQTLTATGGSGSGYTWTATSSNLGTFGLSLSSAGVVSGNPTSAGTASFTAKVTDSAGNSATEAMTFAVYGPLSLPAPNPSTLPAATKGGVYSGTVVASGGSGTYSWTVTGFPQNELTESTSGNTLTVTGTPTATGTVTFTASVTDTATSQTIGPNTYTIAVSNPSPLTLPSANPSSLGSATVNTAYTGSITAGGGAAPYSWTVNTVSVPNNGTPVALTNGLSVTSNGSATLNVTGTPTSTGSVSISAQVTDNLSSTAGPTTYTVTVNAAGSQVSGQVMLVNNCGGVNLPTVTLSIDTSPVQTATTDSNGNYSFASIPNGTYTITPSISGPSSVFSPATVASVVVNNADVNNENFQVALGYTVSGTVSYTGSQTGQVYVRLSPNSCGGESSLGTSLSAAGSYTIRGVPPGTYGLTAFMDALGEGSANASAPSGSTSSVSVGNTNVTGANVSMSDPAAYTLSSGPGFQGISPADQGVVIGYKPITTTINNNDVETPTSYTVQWSTSSSFTSTTSATFKATGANGTNIWIINNGQTGLSSAFSNGTVYYFRACGNVGGSSSPWVVYGGGTPTAVTIGAPTAANTISGTVTYTGTATGPLYVGFYDQSTGAVYTQRLATPTSPAAFSVQVPTGSNYFFFGILDQNNDGLVDAGDIDNTGQNNSSAVSVTGSATMNLTLPSANSTAAVTTTHYQQTNSGGTSTGFNLALDVREGIKLPVAVTVTAGPNVINPIDIAKCLDCGHDEYQYFVGIGGTPTVGDSYSFKVTYSDNTSDTITAQVTAVLNAFPTNLAPSVSSSTSLQPTFSWTDPASAGSYTYSFNLWDNTGKTIWQVPGNNSKQSGFDSSITSLSWGVDPNDGSNTPTPGSLTSGATYNWSITVQDSNGNQAQTTVYYIP